ncbi:STAS domain-containing protein [Planobispora longispora]|uniref:Anti-sigma factor antagonist n=1 Tax=Planobispora longispora TaxID=28887 RepID=A0A8J3W321_9ACTN|nr:STAS domain-containing protein [Planobispora longispora]BFE87400.1 STAS domain-containing protein [Planobispora longispora]GIH74959.1 anti-sigma factor antagonist [Planobispora longispora]
MQHDHGLTITHRPHSARLHVLVVAGDLDHHTAPRLRAALEEVTLAPGAGLVIDLSPLTFCDSTGISILVAAHQRAQGAGAALVLAGLDPDLAHVFRIMGLDRLFSSYDSAEKAVAALGLQEN